MIANTWDRAVAITADFGSAPLHISKATYAVSRKGNDPVYTRLTGPLPPGQVAVVFLSHDPVNLQRVPAALPRDGHARAAHRFRPPRHGAGEGVPHQDRRARLGVLDLIPTAAPTSYMPTATLLLPVSSWTQNYVAVSPFDFGDTGKSARSRLSPTRTTPRSPSSRPSASPPAAGLPGPRRAWRRPGPCRRARSSSSCRHR